MQPATSKGLFSFRFSSRTFWRMVQQQGGGWRADCGVCVSSHRGLGHAHIRGLFMHRGFPPSHFLHPLHPGLLSLALAELSLMPSWRNGGFPCGWADGTLPALAWGALQRVLMRSWCSLSTTSSLGTTPLPTLALSFFSFLWHLCAQFYVQFSPPHHKLWWKRGEWGKTWTNMQGKKCVPLLRGQKLFEKK